MAVTLPPSQRLLRSPDRLARHLLGAHRPLAIFTLAMLGFTVLFALGIFVDDRLIGGQSAWLKPAKFGVSIAIYTLTILWLLAQVRSEHRGVQRFLRAFGWLVMIVFVIEMAIIVLQGIRGTTSHFNVSTALDGVLYSTMGAAITTLWVANLVLAVVVLRQRFTDSAFAWSLRLGLLTAVIGMGQAFLMTSPTAQQLAGWQAGGNVTVAGAHSVGAPDGGPGLPVTGWRTDVGDLRVGHFVGIHGLQVIPFVGWALSRRRRLDVRQRTGLVVSAGAAYLAVVLILTWQALRAQPLLQPDALTLGALGAVAVALGLAVWAVVRRRGPRRA
jgi:hypothetical protein